MTDAKLTKDINKLATQYVEYRRLGAKLSFTDYVRQQVKNSKLSKKYKKNKLIMYIYNKHNSDLIDTMADNYLKYYTNQLTIEAETENHRIDMQDFNVFIFCHYSKNDCIGNNALNCLYWSGGYDVSLGSFFNKNYVLSDYTKKIIEEEKRELKIATNRKNKNN